MTTQRFHSACHEDCEPITTSPLFKTLAKGEPCSFKLTPCMCDCIACNVLLHVSGYCDWQLGFKCPKYHMLYLVLGLCQMAIKLMIKDWRHKGWFFFFRLVITDNQLRCLSSLTSHLIHTIRENEKTFTPGVPFVLEMLSTAERSGAWLDKLLHFIHSFISQICRLFYDQHTLYN